MLEGHGDEIFSCAFNYEGNTIITGEVLEAASYITKSPYALGL